MLTLKDGNYLFPISDIPIKNLAQTHALLLHYQNGSTRMIEIQAMSYLNSLLDGDYELSLKRLVMSLVDFADKAQDYFYGQSRPAYHIMCDTLMEHYARYLLANETLPEESELGNLADALATATIRLGDAPSLYFRAKKDFTGTITLTNGSTTIHYNVVNGMCGESDILLFTPAGAYAFANPIRITVTGSTNAQGEYSIGNYRSKAEQKGMDNVVAVIDALYAYTLNAKAYQNK